jgi:outer membrane murein-binding lipoprotein Lpp
MAVDHLNGSDSKDPHVAELKRALEGMKLDDIDVDVNSPQIMMNEEMMLLRASVDRPILELSGSSGSAANNNSADKSHSSGQTSAADAEKLKALEAENKSLRDLLKEAKSSIASQANSIAPPLPPPSGGGSVPDAETLASLREAQQEIETLNSKIAQLESTIATREKKIASQEEELNRMRAAVSNSASASSDTAKMLEGEIKRVKEEVCKHLIRTVVITIVFTTIIMPYE